MLGLPGLQLLVFLGQALAQLLVVLDLARPVAAGELAVTVDDPLVGLLQIAAATHTEAAQQYVLRGLGVGNRQGHGGDVLEVDFTLHGFCQQQQATVVTPGHRRPGAHALGPRRRGTQRQQQRLRRAGRQGDLAGQSLAIGAFDGDVQGQRPVHGVLHAQAHGARLGPVPGAGLRRQAQGRTLARVEGHAAQDLALGGAFSRDAGQVGVIAGHLHGVHWPHEVEQLLAIGRLAQGRQAEQRDQRQALDRQWMSRTGCSDAQ